MANSGVNAVLIKIAAIGLKPVHLGKSIAQMYPFLCKMVSKDWMYYECRRLII
jgi:diphthine-ammonia ligase